MSGDSDPLSDEARSWIGLELEMKSEPITRRDVEEYLVASDDYHPFYTSDEAARAAGYRDRLVPPLLYMHTVRPRVRQSELTPDGSTQDRRPPVGNRRAALPWNAGRQADAQTPPLSSSIQQIHRRSKKKPSIASG